MAHCKYDSTSNRRKIWLKKVKHRMTGEVNPHRLEQRNEYFFLPYKHLNIFDHPYDIHKKLRQWSFTIFSRIQESLEYPTEYFWCTFGVLLGHFCSTLGALLEYFWLLGHFGRKLICFKTYSLSTFPYPSRHHTQNGREMMTGSAWSFLLLLLHGLQCAL